MSTISNAVQVMVDNLVAKMASNTPLTPEEQSMVAESVALLSKSTTLETALIAVAEKHLDTATSALDSAKVSLQENADYLKLLPQINEIKTSFGNIKTGLDNTLGNFPAVMREGAPATPALAFNWNGAEIATLTNASNSANTSLLESSPVTVTSLFDDAEKCFYVYAGFGNGTKYYSKDFAVKVDAKGNITSANAGSKRISASSSEYFLLIKTIRGVQLAKMTNTALTFFGVMPSLAEESASIPLTGGKIYQEPDTLSFWSYSQGHAQHTTWDAQAQVYLTKPDTSKDFLNEGVFNQWAGEQGYTQFTVSYGSHGSSSTHLGALNQSSVYGFSRPLFHKHMTLMNGQYQFNQLSITSGEAISFGVGNSNVINIGAGSSTKFNYPRAHIAQCSSHYLDSASGAYMSFSGQIGPAQGLNGTTMVDIYLPALIAVSPYHRVAFLSLGSRNGSSCNQKTVVRAF
ncbi:hypothetical protein VA7868_03743 [Vibrio aerogenes CECT 7868]|uniref:Uncharacterized protein n=1 Tax=Vibrio aerogenes CECT 7868 TaxID=1216006 RepID=A0A1M6B8Y0_9VIBR|nr:hypothetical protein [Vibrio aerogenes]SHI45201.1 hypothetical protein VA7868_03743 [Vibrio aerogenes CECT 7868]